MSPKQKQQFKHQKQRLKTRKKIFRKWHRRMGFAASLFLFNLAITGIVLNHYESIDLHKKYIQSDLILDWYNVQAPSKPKCLSAKTSIVCQVGDLIFDSPNAANQLNAINQKPKLLLQTPVSLINLFYIEQNYYLVTSHALMILNNERQLIDKLDLLDEFNINVTAAAWLQNSEQQIPALQKTAKQNTQTDALSLTQASTGQQLILQSANQSLMFDIEDETFTQLTAESELANIKLLNPLSPLVSSQQKTALNQAYKQRQISWLKLVQDLHSGQLFSTSGKLLTDLVGIIVLLLAISGFITWQRRKNNPKGL